MVSQHQAAEHIQVELDGAVAIVTMAKPPHNLLDDAFIEDLIRTFEAVSYTHLTLPTSDLV